MIWRFIPFPRVFAESERNIAYYDSAVQRFNHYTTMTPLPQLSSCKKEIGLRLK